MPQACNCLSPLLWPMRPSFCRRLSVECLENSAQPDITLVRRALSALPNYFRRRPASPATVAHPPKAFTNGCIKTSARMSSARRRTSCVAAHVWRRTANPAACTRLQETVSILSLKLSAIPLSLFRVGGLLTARLTLPSRHFCASCPRKLLRCCERALCRKCVVSVPLRPSSSLLGRACFSLLKTDIYHPPRFAQCFR